MRLTNRKTKGKYAKLKAIMEKYVENETATGVM